MSTYPSSLDWRTSQALCLMQNHLDQNHLDYYPDQTRISNVNRQEIPRIEYFSFFIFSLIQKEGLF
ncbi:unnamed protein product [Paramecium octaurelia]|uniref:Uncharacterized protein n=1 Tax=Paramecium octaurelia TaxID=43137 RepID=A0A8S1XFM7_PAROT|nr:unnamed protein product [Paramecium octaurelia]